RQQAQQGLEQGAFAAAVGTQQAKNLAFGKLQRDVVPDLFLAIAYAQAARCDGRNAGIARIGFGGGEQGLAHVSCSGSMPLMPSRKMRTIMPASSPALMDPEGLYQTWIQLVMPKYSMAMAVSFLRVTSTSGRSACTSSTMRLMMRCWICDMELFAAAFRWRGMVSSTVISSGTRRYSFTSVAVMAWNCSSGVPAASTAASTFQARSSIFHLIRPYRMACLERW